MTRTCARFTAPAPNASPTRCHLEPNASASREDWCTSRVSTASHAAVDRAPVASATSPEAATTRISNACARAMTLDRSTIADCRSTVVR